MVSLKRLAQLMKSQNQDQLILVEGNETFVLKRLTEESSDDEYALVEDDASDTEWSFDTDYESAAAPTEPEKLSDIFRHSQSIKGISNDVHDDDLFESVSVPMQSHDEELSEPFGASPLFELEDTSDENNYHSDDDTEEWFTQTKPETPVRYETFSEEDDQ